ncbi:MAG: hypothetical protein AB7P04_06500 [Bacteriovoracia bacterium]
MRLLSWLVLGIYLFVSPAFALLHELPPSLAPLILSETVPFVFTPADFRAADFEVQWVGPAVPGVQARIGEKSVEWARAAKSFVLPRGRLLVEAEGVEAGRVVNNGFSQTFYVEGGKGTVDLPVAMFSGEKNAIQVEVRRGGKTVAGILHIRYKPRPENEARVLVDTTCSPYNVRAEEITIPKNSWMYLACRFVYSEGDQNTTSSLELFVFWDNVGQTASIDGIEFPSTSVNVWPLRMRAKPGFTTVSVPGQPGQKATIRYGVPEKLRYGALGMGIGPYAYTYTGGNRSTHSYAPLLTFYGSYFMHEAMRLVMFNATAIHKDWFTDTGLYVMLENTRAWDERFSMNLLLGANMIVFPYNGQTYARFGGPQGIELVFRDFLVRRYNFSFGSFVYPKIDGVSYYNVWLRWGPPSFFGELNYVSWTKPIGNDEVFSQSLGITVGFPLTTFC